MFLLLYLLSRLRGRDKNGEALGQKENAMRYNPLLQQPISAHPSAMPCAPPPGVVGQGRAFISRGGVFEGAQVVAQGPFVCSYASEPIQDTRFASIGPYGLPTHNVPEAGHRAPMAFAPLSLGQLTPAEASAMAPVAAHHGGLVRQSAALPCPPAPWGGAPRGQTAKGGIFDGSVVSYGTGLWKGRGSHACYFNEKSPQLVPVRGVAAQPIGNPMRAAPLVPAVTQSVLPPGRSPAAQPRLIGGGGGENQARPVSGMGYMGAGVPRAITGFGAGPDGIGGFGAYDPTEGRRF